MIQMMRSMSPIPTNAMRHIHVVVVSPKFEGKGLEEKTDLILSHLFQALPKDEWGKITLSIGVSPEELKAI